MEKPFNADYMAKKDAGNHKEGLINVIKGKSQGENKMPKIVMGNRSHSPRYCQHFPS